MKSTIILIFLATLIICSCHSKDEAFKKAVALYEIGKLYEENELADSAVIYYSQAYQISKESGNDSLIGDIGNKLGKILQIQNLCKNAIEIHSQSYTYNNRLKDKTAASYSLRAIGKDYLYNTNSNDSIYQIHKDSALVYFTKATQLIPQIRSQEEISSIYNNLSLYYTVDKQYNKALHYNMKAIQFCRDSTNQYRNYLSRGNIYFMLQQLDSAIYYCYLGIKSKDTYTRCAIYYNLADVYSILGSPDSAKYMKLANTLHDSIELKKHGEEIMQTIHQIRIQQFEKKQNNIFWITYLSILLISSILIWCFFKYRRYQKQKNININNEKNNIENILKSLEKEYQNNLSEKELLEQKVLEYTKYCDELKQTLLTSQEKYEALRSEIIDHKKQKQEAIEDLSENANLSSNYEKEILSYIIKIGDLCQKQFLRTKLYKEIKIQSSTDYILLKDQERLFEALPIYYAEYIKALLTYFPFTEREQLICSLICSQLTIQECANCLRASLPSYYTATYRMRNKIKNSSFKPEQAYCIILNTNEL